MSEIWLVFLLLANKLSYHIRSIHEFMHQTGSIKKPSRGPLPPRALRGDVKLIPVRPVTVQLGDTLWGLCECELS